MRVRATRRRPPATTVACLIVSTVAWAGAPAEGATRQTTDPAELSAREQNTAEAVRILRTLRDPDHDPIEDLVPGFTEVGRQVPDILFRMLADGVVPDVGEGSQLLSIYQRELILAAFAKMGEAATRAALGADFEAPQEIGTRIAAVHVLGAVGDSDDLARLLELALVDPEPGPTDAMARAFRQAVRSILVRDPITCSTN